MARPRQYPIQVSTFINQDQLEWLYFRADQRSLDGISSVIRELIVLAMLTDRLEA